MDDLHECLLLMVKELGVCCSVFQFAFCELLSPFRCIKYLVYNILILLSKKHLIQWLKL